MKANQATKTKAVAERQQPRYMTIVKQLEDEIGSGRYPVGECLPGEHNLCQRFDVSRFTVRQALRHLRDAGMVEPRQGMGTVVSRVTPATAYSHSIETLSDILQYGRATYFEASPFETVATSAELARRLFCRRGQKWLRVEGLRYSVGQAEPLSWVEAYVAPEFAGLKGASGTIHQAIWSLIEEQYGEKIERVEQRVRAVAVPEHLSQALKVEPGSPALEFRRSYWSTRGKMIVVSVSLHPGDRYSYSMSMRRETDA